MDTRDLNYAKFFTEGDPEEVAVEDYTSGNTHQLDKDELEKLLLYLPEVRRELDAWRSGGDS
jgi:UDP-glucose 4-epimerase